jgi:hypothetical protein
LCPAASSLAGLEVLGITSSPSASQADLLKQLLTSCPRLTSLDLRDAEVGRDSLEVLLQYGTNLTSLGCRRFFPRGNMTGYPCKWQTLRFHDREGPCLGALAYLPLNTVQSCQLPTCLELRLPVATVPLSEVPSLLLQATTNLAACPAWQAGASTSVRVTHQQEEFSSTGVQTHQAVFTEQQRVLLLEAVAPLLNNSASSLELSFPAFASKFTVALAEVQGLGQHLKHPLKALKFASLALENGVWEALGVALPDLQTLTLHQCKVMRNPVEDLQLFDYLSSRPAGQPFTLRLDANLYNIYEGGSLQRNLHSKGHTHVNVLIGS